jgi:hypothetical protein
MTAANFLINMRNSQERGPEQASAPFNLARAEQQLDILDSAASMLAKTCRPVGT